MNADRIRSAAICVATAMSPFMAGVTWGAAKFPDKGVVTIGKGPLPLFVHYLDGTGQTVRKSLRDLKFEEPPLAKSKELAALAKRPCGRGDVVNLTSSLPGVATGADAAGIGRFVWLVKGQYTTDGARWQFNGTASSKEDFYNFDKKQWGERAFWAEVSTRIGSAFKGTDFKVSIDGSLPISITGTCTLNSAGQALV